MITSDAEITLEKKISENLFILSVKLQRYREWIPGMFLQVSLQRKSASEPWLDSRAFSFASWGSEDARLLVRKEGNFTSELIEKSEAGFVTSVRYPFGSFLLNSKKDKVFIAGGAGVSVFLSYLDYLNSESGATDDVIILHSTKHTNEELKKIYWHDLPDKVSLKQFITDKEDQEYTGRISIEDLKCSITISKNQDYYVCGPGEFNRYWLEKLKYIGIVPNLEQWINQGNKA